MSVKNLVWKVIFTFSLIIFVLFLFISIHALIYNLEAGPLKFGLLCKSIFPDKKITLNSNDFIIKQPYLFGIFRVDVDYEEYNTLQEFGVVRYRQFNPGVEKEWEEISLSCIKQLIYRDICAILYIYNTKEGPVYIIYSLDYYNYKNTFGSGYYTVADILIPHAGKNIAITASKENQEFFVELAKSFVSADENIQFELEDVIYGGRQ